MSGDKRYFVDTNVFLYSVDRTEPRKADAAQQWLDALWATGSGRVSWQVLHEFYVNATRKMGIPKESVRDRIDLLTIWQPLDSNVALVKRAWHWADTAQLSYWDALIVAAAETSGCAYLLSEDLQEGRKLDRLLIVNPFSTPPSQFGLDRPPSSH